MLRNAELQASSAFGSLFAFSVGHGSGIAGVRSVVKSTTIVGSVSTLLRSGLNDWVPLGVESSEAKDTAGRSRVGFGALRQKIEGHQELLCLTQGKSVHG